MTMQSHGQIPPEFLPPEPIPPKTFWQRAWRWIFAVVVLLAFLLISGPRDLFLFFQTDPDFVQPVLLNRVPDKEILRVPVAVQVISPERVGLDVFDKERKRVDQIMVNASSILNQAGIEVYMTSFSFRDDVPEDFFIADGLVQLYFTYSLNGINGVAYRGSQNIVVAEKTSVFDFRVVAHEVAHVLGIGHRDEVDALMSPTASGDYLSNDEIEIMRIEAAKIIEKTP